MDDVVEGSMATSVGEFFPSGEHNEEMSEYGFVIPRKGVLYVDTSDGIHSGKVFRWGGNVYVQVASVGLPTADFSNEGMFLKSDGEGYVFDSVRQLPLVEGNENIGKFLRFGEFGIWEVAEIPKSDVDKEYVDGLVGDISNALDELHAYAQNLVNGGSAE
jgi:hypothetical protein